MDSGKYKSFVSLAKHRNFSLAAEELGISQSALSKHILSLEQEFDNQLYDRNEKALTPSGAEFLHHVKILLADYHKMHHTMKNCSISQKRNITLSAVPVMKVYGLLDLIAAFLAEHPDITMNIMEADTNDVISKLLHKLADVAFAGIYMLKDSDFRNYTITNDELVMVVGKNHRFSKREKINLCEAKDEEFLLLDVATNVYYFAYDQCVMAGFVPKVANSQFHILISTIIDLVSTSTKISLLMLKTVEHFDNDDIKIIRLEGRPTMPFALMTRDEPVSETCRLFIQFAMDYFDTRDQNESTSV